MVQQLILINIGYSNFWTTVIWDFSTLLGFKLKGRKAFLHAHVHWLSHSQWSQPLFLLTFCTEIPTERNKEGTTIERVTFTLWYT